MSAGMFFASLLVLASNSHKASAQNQRGVQMMMTQIVGIQQIVITVVFLSCLIGLLIFLRMKGGSIRANLQKGQRVRVVEETAVSSSERLRLITIDGREFVMLSGKGVQPSIVPLLTNTAQTNKHELSELNFTETGQPPLELTSPVFPSVGEQDADSTPLRDKDPHQMKQEEIAAFAAKFKGWRKN